MRAILTPRSMSDPSNRFGFVAGLQKPALISALFVVCTIVFFHNLGGSALFEPDEGRNAEIAREILLTHDWVTPHYDFIARLDKPVFYYWLIASAYKAFGISEWSARLPSAVAALACVALTFCLALKTFGLWEALWASLILATGVEFSVLSRIVILDMILTCIITLSLCAFYWGKTAHDLTIKTSFYSVMYVCMGIATLIKGPIGIILPGLVIFFYLLHTRKWVLLSQMRLGLGAAVVLLVAASWYVWAEIRNPGQARYFFVEENLLRFLTARFERSQPWYYFFSVLLIGFLPWTLLLGPMIEDLRHRPFNDVTVFLLTWLIVPLFFYSFSNSKLPHYILPVYPPLAILAGRSLSRIVRDRSGGANWELCLPWVTVAAALLFMIITLVWPDAVPEHVRKPIQQSASMMSWHLIAITAVVFCVLALVDMIALSRKPGALYLSYCLAFVTLFLPVHRVIATVSHSRSSKELAKQAAPFIGPQHQVVLYDAYLSSLPFYLRARRPLWVVWSGKKARIMGSAYVGENLPRSAIDQEKVLFTYEEFSRLRRQTRDQLAIFTHVKDLDRVNERGVGPLKKLLQVGDVVLMADE